MVDIVGPNVSAFILVQNFTRCHVDVSKLHALGNHPMMYSLSRLEPEKALPKPAYIYKQAFMEKEDKCNEQQTMLQLRTV